MQKTTTGKPRIVLYGAGQFGQYFARLADQKGWPIVAAFNRAGEKVGKDIGRLAGLNRDLGVVVQDSETASYDKLDADVAMVSTSNSIKTNMPAYQRLMGAGLNIACLAGEAMYPQGTDPKLAAEIDALAKKNNVTFTGGGIWDISRIWPGILTAGACTEIKSMYHRSITDCSRQIISKKQAYEVCIGITKKQFYDEGYDKNPIATLYKTISQHVFHALGYTIGETTVRIEPVIFDIPMPLALFEKPIPAGDCVGTRIIVDCATKEGPTAKSEIELRLFKEGEIEHMFWQVKGRPEISYRVERNDSAHATAACLFNRVPDILKAQPGVVLISQMGPLKHTALI
jgi:4-hydroxy-tetrahydrodipicolinate reductase